MLSNARVLLLAFLRRTYSKASTETTKSMPPTVAPAMIGMRPLREYDRMTTTVGIGGLELESIVRGVVDDEEVGKSLETSGDLLRVRIRIEVSGG